MKPSSNRYTALRIILLFSIILVCYSNSLRNGWQLDDSQNILENPAIHIQNLQPETIKNTFYAEPTFNDKLYRPVASFTFALNWYFGQDNPFGYHVVNVLIHILVATFLFKVSVLLFQLPRSPSRPAKETLSIALLGAALWAVNPVQTQAVTYIVQRMASLGAMFFLLALWQYLQARFAATTTLQRLGHLFLCGLFFLLSLGCKENAITLIPTLLLVELIFLKRSEKFEKSLFVLLVLVNIFLFLAACYYIFNKGLLTSFFLPFGNRPFSIAERLLTQASILFFYISLLFFPDPSRLSIDHSFPISTSIWSPWTTLPSIIGIFLLIAISIVTRRKAPLASFAILFFIINHLVESTIIPLEMIFEHRNYLPSMFLFLAMADGLWRLVQYTASRLRLVHATLLLLIPFILIVSGLGTYARNFVWASEESLWADALKKAPNNARPWAKLGIIYGWQKEKSSENLRKSVALSLKATELDFPDVRFKAAFIDNIAKVYSRYGLLDESIRYSKKALEINDQFLLARTTLADTLQIKGDFFESLEQINIILAEPNINKRFHIIKSTILLWLGKPNQAVEENTKYMIRSKANKQLGYYSLGLSLTKAGNIERGYWFLKRAQRDQPKEIRIILGLVENRALAERPTEAQEFASQLLVLRDLPTIQNMLQTLRTDYTSPPIDIDLIVPFIVQAANEQVSKLTSRLTVQP